MKSGKRKISTETLIDKNDKLRKTLGKITGA